MKSLFRVFSAIFLARITSVEVQLIAGLIKFPLFLASTAAEEACECRLGRQNQAPGPFPGIDPTSCPARISFRQRDKHARSFLIFPIRVAARFQSVFFGRRNTGDFE